MGQHDERPAQRQIGRRRPLKDQGPERRRQRQATPKGAFIRGEFSLPALGFLHDGHPGVTQPRQPIRVRLNRLRARDLHDLPRLAVGHVVDHLREHLAHRVRRHARCDHKGMHFEHGDKISPLHAERKVFDAFNINHVLRGAEPTAGALDPRLNCAAAPTRLDHRVGNQAKEDHADHRRQDPVKRHEISPVQRRYRMFERSSMSSFSPPLSSHATNIDSRASPTALATIAWLDGTRSPGMVNQARR